MKLHAIAFILVVVGGLNWGLVAIGYWMGSNWNVVHFFLGTWPMAENLVYLLVGISAIVLLMGHMKSCRECNPSGAQ